MATHSMRQFTLALLSLFGASASAATLTDDFESTTTGSFPAAQWLDAAQPFALPPPFINAAQPSATVVATTHAFGAATQALQTVDALGVAKGIYAAVPVSATYSLKADIRTPRFADSSAPTAGPASDWTMQLTFAQTGVDNFSVAPQAGHYVSSLTHSWRFFLIGANGGPFDDLDLGVAATPDTWYTVSLGIDAVNGNFHSVITDTLTGSVLVDDSHGYAGWQASYAAYEAIAFFGGETAAQNPALPGSKTIAGLGQVDNVSIQAVPKPSTWCPMAAGLDGLMLRRRRRSG